MFTAVGCAELNDPYYSGGGWNDPYANDPYYRDDRDRDRVRDERRDLERERDRLEAERYRLEREREREASAPVYSPPPPARREDRCPPGFSPSERKCSQQERRNGCRDIRTPGGLGCVSR